jgi:hypothetical protein
VDEARRAAAERERIVAALRAALEPEPRVHALWLEGSLANGTADELSDVDLWIDVDDEWVDGVLPRVAEILGQLGELDFDYPLPRHPSPLIRQRFFHLAGTPEWLTIDVCAQAHGRNFNFTYEDADERPLVLFDKSGVVRFEHRDRAAFAAELAERVAQLRQELRLFEGWTRKRVARGTFLEALAYYEGHVLPILVELLRIRYRPDKRGYHLKHADCDLPPEVAARVAALYRIGSIEDVGRGVASARELFEETLAGLWPAQD